MRATAARVVLGLTTACTPALDSTLEGSSTSSSSSGSSGSPESVGDSGVGPTDESTTGVPEATTGGGASSSGFVWETEGADEGYATTSGCGFTCPSPPPTGGSSCDVAAQDCDQGEKCAPWANDGGLTWNSVRCVPLHPNPGGRGAPCEIEGSPATGIDTCDVGLWCGPDSIHDPTIGTCRPLCNNSACPGETVCVVPGTLDVGVCEAACDPLVQDACPEGRACMPAGFAFGCHITAPQRLGEACSAWMDCGAGQVCLSASHCGDAERCCVQFCDQGTPNCGMGQTCVDYGSPLAAHANVGYCEG